MKKRGRDRHQRDIKRVEDKGLEVLKKSRRKGGKKRKDEWLWPQGGTLESRFTDS